jgi:hypothetical protein
VPKAPRGGKRPPGWLWAVLILAVATIAVGLIVALAHPPTVAIQRMFPSIYWALAALGVILQLIDRWRRRAKGS